MTFKGENSQGDRSGVTSRVNSEGVGNAEGVKISTTNLSLKNGGQINSGTSATGKAGEINIIVRDSLYLSNDARVTVSSRGQENAGNLTITTDDLTLEQESSLSAETVASNGGNIQLNVSNLLSLQDSNISTTAGSEGMSANGGNIDINADLVVAMPSGDSDITAKAFQGTGGAININAQGILGIAERDLNSQTNDINASSSLGIDGTITINTIGSESFQETTEPPANIVESDEVVARTCALTKRAEDILAEEESTLTIQKRSTISSHQIDLMTSNEILDRTSSASGDKKTRERKQEPILTAQGAVYPARGVVRQADGTLILTAYDNNYHQRTPSHSPNCV